MGYRANFTGEITITPPLTYTETRRLPASKGDLTIRLDEEISETDTGHLTVITGVAIEPSYPEGKGYDMLAELQSLVAAFGKDHEFTGHIEAVGEGGDRWRLFVRDGQAVQVYPQIIWDEP